MAVGLSHVARARHVGRNRGRTPFCPLPTTQHTTNESTESTGFDVGRHRTVTDFASPETGSPGLVREEPGVKDHARRRTPSTKGRVMRNQERSQLLLVF